MKQRAVCIINDVVSYAISASMMNSIEFMTYITTKMGGRAAVNLKRKKKRKDEKKNERRKLYVD